MASKNFEFFTTKYEQIAKIETLFILPTTPLNPPLVPRKLEPQGALDRSPEYNEYFCYKLDLESKI